MNTDNPLNPTGTSPGTAGTAPDAERLRQDASTVADTARRDLDRVRHEAESSVREIADQAQVQLNQATEKVKGAASQQKDMLADQLGSMARAVSRVADELQGEQAATAGYVNSIAGGMRRLSENVRDHDVDDLVRMAQDFGRRQPATFMGAAALAGFAASRFLLASGRRRATAQDGGGTMGAGYGSTASTYPDGGPSAAGNDAMEGSIR